MSKRFTETLKWSDPWFQDLAPIYKCAWWYILDNCDNAGVWIVNTKLMSFQVGLPCPWEGVRAAMEDRLVDFAPSKVWVPKFIEFQYGRLSTLSKPHIKVLSLLRGHGLEELYNERLRGYSKGIDTLKEEDKEEDKEKEEEGGPGETKPVKAGQPDHDRAKAVAALYPAKAPKDGRPISFPLTALNMLAVRIAQHSAYPWEKHASLCGTIPTPQDGLKWVEDMPNPITLAKLEQAAGPSTPARKYYR